MWRDQGIRHAVGGPCKVGEGNAYLKSLQINLSPRIERDKRTRSNTHTHTHTHTHIYISPSTHKHTHTHTRESAYLYSNLDAVSSNIFVKRVLGLEEGTLFIRAQHWDVLPLFKRARPWIYSHDWGNGVRARKRKSWEQENYSWCSKLWHENHIHYPSPHRSAAVRWRRQAHGPPCLVATGRRLVGRGRELARCLGCLQTYVVIAPTIARLYHWRGTRRSVCIVQIHRSVEKYRWERDINVTNINNTVQIMHALVDSDYHSVPRWGSLACIHPWWALSCSPWLMDRDHKTIRNGNKYVGHVREHHHLRLCKGGLHRKREWNQTRIVSR